MYLINESTDFYYLGCSIHNNCLIPVSKSFNNILPLLYSQKQFVDTLKAQKCGQLYGDSIYNFAAYDIER